MINNALKKLTSVFLSKRIISGIVIGLIFLISIFQVRSLFFPLIIFIATIMLTEWYNMTHKRQRYLYLGLPIITIPIISIFYISNIDPYGWLLLSFFAIIWCVDTVAMCAGKTFQGPKLAPQISPNKTISGLASGVLASSTLPILFDLIPNYDISYYINGDKFSLMLKFGFIAMLAQMSDLFISFFKRKFKVKDSGDIIPGHGGMLDRFDSIILTAPLIALYLCI